MAKQRVDFESIYKWNVKDLFKSDDEFKKEVKSLEKEIKKFQEFEGHILDSAENLYNLLELDSNLGRRLERCYIYAHINNDADTTDINYQEIFGEAQNIYTKYLEVTAYVVPELLQKDYKIITKYLKELPALKKYERSLKHIFRAKEHILSNEVEKALTSFTKLMSSPEEIAGSLTDSDFKFDNIMVDGKSVELNESNYAIYIRDNDRSVRKQAFDSLYKTYGNFKNTIATILKHEVEKNVSSAKLRHYKSSLEASLFPNEIPEEVYHNLIKSIHQNLPSLYRYWGLKKKLLHLDE